MRNLHLPEAAYFLCWSLNFFTYVKCQGAIITLDTEADYGNLWILQRVPYTESIPGNTGCNLNNVPVPDTSNGGFWTSCTPGQAGLIRLNLTLLPVELGVPDSLSVTLWNELPRVIDYCLDGKCYHLNTETFWSKYVISLADAPPTLIIEFQFFYVRGLGVVDKVEITFIEKPGTTTPEDPTTSDNFTATESTTTSGGYTTPDDYTTSTKDGFTATMNLTTEDFSTTLDLTAPKDPTTPEGFPTTEEESPETTTKFNFNCPPTGTHIFPYPGNCSLFIRCIFGTPNIQSCPAEWLFDIIDLACKPEDVAICEMQSK